MGRSETPRSESKPARNKSGGVAWSALPVLLALLSFSSPSAAQTATTTNAALPRVVIPTTTARTVAPARPTGPARGILYPWRQNITATVFWVGEMPTQNNPTPNHKSSWDQKWAENFGGYDNPDPGSRIADHRSGEFRPKNFTPRLNPFYVALPYNDVAGWAAHKPEACKVIPWFARMKPEPGKTVLKGRWIQIYNGKRSCYAQWEDCGPWVTDDWEYVFQGKPPKNTSNKAAGIDISPSVRDYLDLQSGQKCHWRFVEASQVPYGPWKKYGQEGGAAGPEADAQRRYLEYLRKLRDEQYQRKSKSEMESGR